jgi:cephalosporin hydroxylase
MEGKTFHYHTHILHDIRTSLGDSVKTYLEIGSYAGGSMSFMSSHIYPTKCYTVDLGYPMSQDIVERNVERFKNHNSSFRYFMGDSQDKGVIDIVRNEVKKIDILFIDGDHSRKGVLSDFTYYSDLVNIGGYIVFDDYLDYEFSPEVRGAVDEIVKEMNTDEYEIIGSLKYDLLSEFTKMDTNNLFVVKKIK